ncbi:hypothetical protein EOD41_10440 [Mucilaginibacter limnophilus]|uniref:Outer membrane protein beta-barrel domain-containing protein n=1 Tax=Mucilaginibacter limnophilus TaxID=1932778 RepID=A0A437MTW6_9SPHI|nr:outer membrane beta-barrel protein [Mucilaginibacter limnophilus]RVU01030.1 hypothetical protein EOD41_10440 [Mucilaginibacter limnophilus]
MTNFLKAACFLALQLLCVNVYSQALTGNRFDITITDDKSQSIPGATVKMLKDTITVKTTVSNGNGIAGFTDIPDGTYTFKISYTGFKVVITKPYIFPSTTKSDKVVLQAESTALQEVSVTGRIPFAQQKNGKTVLNVDASPTNTGLTVLEVLEKSPGVTVDRNGGITLQGKAGVLVMIDDKPTYLSGADLNNLLGSMNSAQVAQIELMPNPPAKYDAAGNAGIINIKTKKNKQQGFNGSVTTSAGYGVYPKNNNNLVLNYRTGKVNTFLNYNMTLVEYLTDIYALRKYYDADNNLTSMLDQPTYFSGVFINNTVKTGLDYYVTPKTTIGFVLGGTAVKRRGNNKATATWLSQAGEVDSVITTLNKSNSKFRNGSVNLSARHAISATQDIAVDVDWLHYTIESDQNFNNSLVADDGYVELSRGNIPTTINIRSAKADYSIKGKNDAVFQLGWKSSLNSTDNTASYENFTGGQWLTDYSKTNRFLYDENIQALYSTYERKFGKLSLQACLRYEHTGYNAHQLGNAMQKDSAFTRTYSNLFPSGYVTYQADSVNSFTLTAGRRIDRPAFQNLNPFYFIINKYTYQTGNPFILPQFSWNFEVSHQFKELLTTTVSYSNINNYFSQIFLADEAKGVLLYTQGNVGSAHNIGVSTSVNLSPFKWWTFMTQAVYNYKQLKGFNGNNFTTDINQLNVNSTSQFMFGRYTAELSGFYTTRARNDVQELLYPTGQVSVGLSAPILNKKGTLKFSARDLFYTNAMEGLTSFPNATEYFKLMRDSRVFTLSFTYRFGKSFKTGKRTSGSAADEMERVGNG